MISQHTTLNAALSAIQSLQLQGFTSFKLYKSDTLWWVGLSNVCVNDRGDGK